MSAVIEVEDLLIFEGQRVVGGSPNEEDLFEAALFVDRQPSEQRDTAAADRVGYRSGMILASGQV
jgi:hypothetical protein